MTFRRSSGILMHPTSLPGPYGIGDLGPEAFTFIDTLAESGCRLWQVLPLGPTGYGDSPYQCFSAFAGSPYLVSPELLLNEGLLTPNDLADMPTWDPNRVDFGIMYQWKPALLQRAYRRLVSLDVFEILRSEFKQFCAGNSGWLDEYAIFMTIKDIHGGKAWNEWEETLRTRQKPALEAFSRDNYQAIEQVKCLQFLFYRQWNALKTYANQKNIQIIGDIPIFVAMDSADTWANPELFYLDGKGSPTVVAGVPPDYFSETGQLWGNPLYKWEIHKNSGYVWWIDRIKAALGLYDIVRIDHFRGFAGYWEIPFGEKTAINGRWVKGPGADLFDAIKKALGDLPIIAEDLGEITPDVVELRDQFGLPGMKILQFAFSGPDNPFLPHLYPQNCVVYTGTHDNDTSWGWYMKAPEHEIRYYHEYLNRGAEDVPGDMVNTIWSSVAMFALAPMQDLLGLRSEDRMNFPGKVGGYWAWRMKPGSFNTDLVNRLKKINWVYYR